MFIASLMNNNKIWLNDADNLKKCQWLPQ